MKKTFYSGRPVNILIMFPHTTKKRYVSSGWEVGVVKGQGDLSVGSHIVQFEKSV